MWALHDYSLPKRLEKDLTLLSFISKLYLLYKKQLTDDSLVKEIHALYHSQLFDEHLQELFIPLMTHLHHPDDFVSAFENRLLQKLGMSAYICKWLMTISSSLFHLLQETEEKEELVFHFLFTLFALSIARNFPCIENGFWKWASPIGRNFFTLFPNFLCNYCYWKNHQKGSLDWEGCQKMMEDFLGLFSLANIPFFDSMKKTLQERYEQMKQSAHHWPQGPHGWPSAMEKNRGGKWIEEMSQLLLFYLSADTGFVTACRSIEHSAFLYNYTKELFALFSLPMTVKNVEAIVKKFDELPPFPEEKDPSFQRLFSSLLSWRQKFKTTLSFSVEYFDPKKRMLFSAKVPETLEHSLFRPEKVEITLISEKGNTFSTHLAFLFTKELFFKGLPDPRRDLQEAFSNLS
jgi:hypothetical protein